MPAGPADTGRMIELLSLEQNQGVYQMEVGVNYSSGTARSMLVIDEYTYLQLNELGPFAGKRVRLSLYPKWDPFRSRYFSALTAMNETFSGTQYYACSGEYAAQLTRLRQKEYLPAGPERLTPVLGPEGTAEAAQLEQEPPRLRIRPQLTRTVLLRGMLFSCLIALFLLRMDGSLIGSSAEAQEEAGTAAEGAAVGNTAAEAVPFIRRAAYQGSPEQPLPLQKPAPLSPQPSASLPQEKAKLVEEIELDGSGSEYSLPAGYVALTFDDGPSRYTGEIVDILQKYGVAATFLFVGQNAVRHPAAVRYAAEHGNLIGSHSWDHSDMTRNSNEENRDNLEQVTRELERSTKTAVTIFRPPYGAVNDELAAEAARQHLKLLLWNRDPEDWKADHAQQVLRYFQRTDPSGSIYLLHEKAVTVEALPEIIEHLQAKGLKFAIFK